MNKNIRSTLLVGAGAAALVVGTPLGAGAAVGANAAVGVSEDGPSVSTLERLSHTQSRAEIDALVDGTDPVRLLVDAATGRVEAAAPIRERALTPIGPGCSDVSVCMRTISGTPYGLTGTVSY